MRVYVVVHEPMMYACICGCACESMMYIYACICGCACESMMYICMRVYVVVHVSQ